MSFPKAQQVNLLACAPHCPFNAERQAGKAVNSNFKVIGLIRLKIKPEATAPGADALNAWTFLRSYVAQTLSHEDGPRHSLHALA